jgi:hypothetical protein
MTRKTIIFGNGLGMALNPSAFSLDTALNEIWNQSHVLTQEDKALIGQCIGHDGPPKGEYELEKLHLSITSCDLLESISDPCRDIHWLSDIGRRFPSSTSNYIHKVANYFHSLTEILPDGFINPLIEFIRNTGSHVATLNYDSLIYRKFLDGGLFNGYRGVLVDGMLDGGFSESSLERRYGNDFGYYMHLHGSPLFYDENGVVRKLSSYYSNVNQQDFGRHIVLTHVKHKPSIIDNSVVLTTYWEYLSFCLSESEEIILVGYSGEDHHLNKVLRIYSNIKPIRIIEWEGAGDYGDRLRFWRQSLGSNTRLFHLESILSFSNW